MDVINRNEHLYPILDGNPVDNTFFIAQTRSSVLSAKFKICSRSVWQLCHETIVGKYPPLHDFMLANLDYDHG